MSDFVHLHVHSEYSLLDGACRVEKLIAKAKSLGQKALAITDHGVMYGVVDFYKECNRQGIKPIIGCEVYVAPRTRHDKQHGFDNQPYHLILLCKNETGYKNLIKMVSAAFVEGLYSKPRIDRQLLEKHHEGLICLSACLAGEVPRNLNKGDYAEAKKATEYYRDLFGEGNYFLEIQNHGINEQIKILPLMQKLSAETGVPMVATNDTHYLEKEDAHMQKVLVCIATNRTIHEDNMMEFATEEFYLKSEQEMRQLFGTFKDSIENTKIIADSCNLDFVFGKTKLPTFTAPNGEDNQKYIEDMCCKGLRKHYGENPSKEVIGRLEYELKTITDMGYVDYFLIVHDFIAYAKNVGIPVGPGRGSGAGSIVAYCIGITGIDPMKYNLIFERFLNPERISMPDFDIDFCYVRRQEVIDYVVKKYGNDHVAQIITFGTMAARGALRDVGRALGMSYASVDTVAKAVPNTLGMTLDKALEIAPDLKKLYAENAQNKELINTARKIEGMARHASTHAAGVVITKEPADSYVPLQKNDESIVTQYPMGTLEELGLLKFDFLGLRNLTVIRDVETELENKGISFSIEDIPLDDEVTFELLGQGQTNGVFQFESGGMKNVIMQLGPEHMEDLIAVISLYRPGPMDSIPRYIKSRHNPALITYQHPALKSILEVTYGCIVYQEQVMEICRELAGYSYGRADLVRRAMSKKKHDVMEKERHNFIWGAKKEDGSVECVGAVANGIDEKSANIIFDDMNDFASYAFNKSHAAAYALISYQTAYLKCHYPKEYMAALLTSVLDNTSKVTDYIGEAQRMGINVLPPNVNQSNAGFTVTDEGIRFGLLAVKNLGRGFINEMVSERENGGMFNDLGDFTERMYGKELSRRGIEGLIKCGAFDNFQHNRHQMVRGYEKILENVESDRKNNLTGQLDFFSVGGMVKTDDINMPKVEEYSIMQLLSMEKESCGLYLSGHPLTQYEDTIKRLKTATTDKILQNKYRDNDLVRLIGIIMHKRSLQTKKGDMMAFVKVEDKLGEIECIVFPKVFEENSKYLNEGEIVVVKGRVKIGDEEDAQIICEKFERIEEVLNNGTANHKKEITGIYLKMNTENAEQLLQLSQILELGKGTVPVYYYFADTEKYLRTPQALWVSPDREMIFRLKESLGVENVVCK